MRVAKIPWKAVCMMAGVFTVLGANTACWWIAHEPEMPEEVKKLRKF